MGLRPRFASTSRRSALTSPLPTRVAILAAAVLLATSALVPGSASADESGMGLGTPRPAGIMPPPSAPVPSLPRGTAPRGDVPAAPSTAGFTRAPVSNLSPATQTRLRVLGADLIALRASTGGGITDGVVSTLSGGLLITLGALSDDDAVRPYFFMLGSVSLGNAIVDFAIRPDPVGAASQFTHMPSHTPALAQERILFGERALERLARQGRLARVLDGTLSIGSGAAILPLLLDSDGFDRSNINNYVLLFGAGISVVRGVVSIANRSPAERRWSAYQQMRDGMMTSARPARGLQFADLRVGLGPESAMGVAIFRF